ncbi:MAG: DUF99 family protein [Candidatus Micrarchaeia archaeon]
MKAGARVLGIDDSPFTGKTTRVLVIGVVWREGVIEGVLSTYIKKDGLDSTKRIIEMVKNSKFSQQIRLILLHGATLGGFNVVDLNELNRALSIPVIAVTRKKPDMRRVKSALKNLPSWERRIRILESAGKAVRCGKVYCQIAGIEEGEVRKLILSFKGIPEPVRLAHLIGSGVVRGESHGRV